MSVEWRAWRTKAWRQAIYAAPMEGLLHPVGPEDARTYWLRRVVLVAALVIVVAGFGSVISSMGGRTSSVAAEPSVPTTQEEDRAAADSPKGAAPPPSGNVPPAPPNAVVADEAVPLPTPAQIPAASASQVPDPAPGSASSPAPLPPEEANTFHLSTATPTPSGTPTPTTCDSRALEVKLDGTRQVSVGVPVKFRVIVTNTAEQECVVTMDDKSFELTVFSGSDRIWSTRDCASAAAPRATIIAPDRNLEWELEWGADRSAPQCRENSEPMGSGTYVATAQLTGAKPARLVMQLEA